MLKKLVGFLTVLCLAIFISGCSSSPDVSGTYGGYNKNGLVAIVVLEKKNNNDLYECSHFYISKDNKRYKKSSAHWLSKFNPEIKQMVADPNNDPLSHRPLFFSDDLSSLGFKKVNTETFKKLSKEDAKKYDKFVEE